MSDIPADRPADRLAGSAARNTTEHHTHRPPAAGETRARRVVYVPGMARPAADAEEFFPLLPANLEGVTVGRPLRDEPFDLVAAVDAIVQACGSEPTVLVAHSFGAYLAELAAHRLECTNPGQVVSLVLLDPSITDLPDPLLDPDRLWQCWRPAIRTVTAVARAFPAGSRPELLVTQLAVFLRENCAFRSTAQFLRQVRAAGGPATIAVPSIVVSALNPGNVLSRRLRRNSWADKHSALASQLRAHHVSISPSTHLVFNDHPERVAEIVEAYC